MCEGGVWWQWVGVSGFEVRSCWWFGVLSWFCCCHEVTKPLREKGYDVLVVDAGPVSSPLAALATELYEAYSTGRHGARNAGAVQQWLTELELVDTLHRLRGKPGGKLLVVLDQAEALLAGKDTEVAQVVDVLFPESRPVGAPSVLVTLRAALVDAALRHPSLGFRAAARRHPAVDADRCAPRRPPITGQRRRPVQTPDLAVRGSSPDREGLAGGVAIRSGRDRRLLGSRRLGPLGRGRCRRSAAVCGRPPRRACRRRC